MICLMITSFSDSTGVCYQCFRVPGLSSYQSPRFPCLAPCSYASPSTCSVLYFGDYADQIRESGLGSVSAFSIFTGLVGFNYLVLSFGYLLVWLRSPCITLLRVWEIMVPGTICCCSFAFAVTGQFPRQDRDRLLVVSYL